MLVTKNKNAIMVLQSHDNFTPTLVHFSNIPNKKGLLTPDVTAAFIKVTVFTEFGIWIADFPTKFRTVVTITFTVSSITTRT